MQNTPQSNDPEGPDELTVILGFAQMLCDSANPDAVTEFANDHGWLGTDGQPTDAGSQLARALLQQRGTRTAFRVW